MVIYLDMDGVVSDAHQAFLTAMGREDLIPNYHVEHAGEFDVNKAAGMTAERMWSMVEAVGRGLWSRMPELPWAHELYERLKKVGDVVFLTTPSQDPESLAGKLEWLHRFTKRGDFKDYIMTARKDLLAGPGRMLVDDRLENVTAFREAGGAAILFPATWQGKTDDEIWESLPIVVAHVEEAGAR